MEGDPNLFGKETCNGVVYEIFVQSWADGNGDGIGDFQGAAQKLDYLQELGVSAIWLMPIMPSPSYHKYDVTDYKSIHIDYGTIDDFKVFLSEAHKRNLKVIIDMVIHHTSKEHPWFKEAVKGKNNAFREYYIWSDATKIGGSISKKELQEDSDNIRQWHSVKQKENQEYYSGYFSGDMPDLNFDNPQVRKEVFDIGRFWLAEIGVDGFRLDAAKHIYPEDRLVEAHAFWQEYRAEMLKINPEVHLVGEVWDSDKIRREFAKGLPALFNFELAANIQQSISEGRSFSVTAKGALKESWLSKLIKNRALLKAVSEDYEDAIFLSNHDQRRVMTTMKGDVKKAKLAVAILMTLPGTPYLYYGEEIGMLGQKPDEHIREPFLWDEVSSDSFRTQWIKSKFSTDKRISPLSTQMKDNTSIWNHYRLWINFRNHLEILSKGELEELENHNSNLLAFTRVRGAEKLYVIHNLSAKKQPFKFDCDQIIMGKENLKNSYISPFSSIIFR